ncbi:hypothetical protein MIND_00811900 [Mycena indigotica]|uniref:Secreted protein n=1 Tax=Mycena indigotica TaxID=2126181 RepID=A0A8H6SFM3_9AGAR|nr:uncharacterized protein MIND_00811900 [Mycena indigotica]KAF7298648.1 hypothetical protein MIND_00811900 [Mycena indigotica]
MHSITHSALPLRATRVMSHGFLLLLPSSRARACLPVTWPARLGSRPRRAAWFGSSVARPSSAPACQCCCAYFCGSPDTDTDGGPSDSSPSVSIPFWLFVPDALVRTDMRFGSSIVDPPPYAGAAASPPLCASTLPIGRPRLPMICIAFSVRTLRFVDKHTRARERERALIRPHRRRRALRRARRSLPPSLPVPAPSIQPTRGA